MVFSSVAGHLLELDFVSPYNTWRGCAPGYLYEAPVAKQVSKGEGEKIKRNLQRLARSAKMLILWLDCDREGENIAFEVLSVCREVNPRMEVKRARFSALISSDIFRAVHNLIAPDENQSAAVDARQEIDLRIGSSFTRLQTLLLQDAFDWTEFLPSDRERMLLSYGPCQFPTLGLIVKREWEIQSHVHENFWTIYVQYAEENGPSAGKARFNWERGNLFDRAVAAMYHNMCIAQPEATVVDIAGAQRRRNAPVPLCTLELQKKGSQYLRMSGEKIMKLAEELYQNGFISYPRTETTLYAQGYDLRGLVRSQAESGKAWSGYASQLLDHGFRWPLSGGKDDGAHPPIHPTKPYDYQGQNAQEKGKIYEFIVRHFLASCSPDAIGQETKISISIADETFSCTGLMVVEKNWLEVFPWTHWGGSESLPRLQPNQTFTPRAIDFHEGTTQPPPRMRETDLLAKMDEYGIGTDATVADHIAKQLDRGYATKDSASMTFAPTSLGESLISAYCKMGLENLWWPTLRGIIEQNIDAVARGIRTKTDVLSEAIVSFKRDFDAANEKSHILRDEVGRIVFAGRAQVAPQQPQGQPFAPCSCGAQLILSRQDGIFSVACAIMHAGHVSKKTFPRRVTRDVQITEELCVQCGNNVRKLSFTFDSGLLPPSYRHMARCSRCVRCDREFADLLQTIGPSSSSRRRERGRGGRTGGRGSGTATATRRRGGGGRMNQTNTARRRGRQQRR